MYADGDVSRQISTVIMMEVQIPMKMAKGH